MASKEHFGSAVNYISERDPVPFIADPVGVLQGCFSNSIQVKFLPSKAMPFMDHKFQGDTYSKAVADEGKFFLEQLHKNRL